MINIKFEIIIEKPWYKTACIYWCDTYLKFQTNIKWNKSNKHFKAFVVHKTRFEENRCYGLSCGKASVSGADKWSQLQITVTNYRPPKFIDICFKFRLLVAWVLVLAIILVLAKTKNCFNAHNKKFLYDCWTIT